MAPRGTGWGVSWPIGPEADEHPKTLMTNRLLNALLVLARLVRRPAGLLFAGTLLIFGLALVESHDAATNLVYRIFVALEVFVPMAERFRFMAEGFLTHG